MARIAGVNIPSQKPVGVALTYIFGIGRTTAEKICAGVGVDFQRRVNELTDAEVARLRERIDRDHKVEGDLRREIQLLLQHLARRLPQGRRESGNLDRVLAALRRHQTGGATAYAKYVHGI